MQPEVAKMPRGQMPPLQQQQMPDGSGEPAPFLARGQKHAPARSTHAARQKAAAWLHHPKLSAGYKSP